MKSTVKQWIKEYGWQVECDMSVPFRSMDVDIDFEVDGSTDEVQFTIKPWDVNELAELFRNFCKESNYPANSVTSVTVVATYPEQPEYVTA